MTRLETITFEYDECGECPNPLNPKETGRSGWTCAKAPKRIIHSLWGEGIPDWCPLPKKEGK